MAQKIDFKIIDGIRGIAATYVLINHARGNMLMGGSEYSTMVPVESWSILDKLFYAMVQTTILGREFVVLFFVLSGFSIAHSLRNKTGIWGFYLRRLIRLYPPYILALIYAFIAFILCSDTLGLSGKSVFDSLQSTLLNLVYIPTGQVIPQFWSLPHEVIFYILAPAILFLKNRLNIYYLLSIGIYIVSLIIEPFNLTGKYILTNFILDYNLFFAIGIFLYHNLDRFKQSKWINLKSFILTSLIFLPTMILLKIKFGEYNKFSSFIMCIYALQMIPTFLKLNLKNKLLEFLGKISYTLYITHFASIYLTSTLLIELGVIDKQFTSLRWVWILGIFTSILASFLLYLIAERPSKSILKKLRKSS